MVEPSQERQSSLVTASQLLQALQSQYSKSRLFYWGMKNAWNIVQAIHVHILYARLSKSNDTSHMQKMFDAYGLGAQLIWRGLSGSDDFGWAGLCLADAYRMTGRQDYLTWGKKINGARGAVQFFDEITNGYLDCQQGGIFWNANHSYKATISNSLYMELALSLYQLTGDDKYRDAAEQIYTWLFEDTEIITPMGDVQDGIDTKSKQIERKVWTYNPGVLVGALTELYRISQQDVYLDKAILIATAVMKNQTWDGMLTESANLNSDQRQFKGICVRHLASLVEWLLTMQHSVVDQQLMMYHSFGQQLAQFITNQAQQVLNTKINNKYQCSAQWHPSEDDQYDAISQVSGIDLMLAYSRVANFI